jgi:hypothetical protein
MKILDQYYCSNNIQAKQIEQKYIDFYKPTMNTSDSYIKDETFNNEIDKFVELKLNNNYYSEKILGCFLYDYICDYDDSFCNTVVCNICKNVLKNKTTLDYHLKNNKKCLLLQNKNIELYRCEFYGNELSLYNFRKHMKVCKSKRESDYMSELLKKKKTN